MLKCNCVRLRGNCEGKGKTETHEDGISVNMQ